jgi:beta-lactamase regulating signal transducer with metallopeptidase domain
MNGYLVAWGWLVRAAVSGLLVLAVGSVAALLCRQPVRRARIVVLTLLGALAVPWLGSLPMVPEWSAGFVLANPAAPPPARGEARALAASTALPAPGDLPARTVTIVADSADTPRGQVRSAAAPGSAPRAVAAFTSRLTGMSWQFIAISAYAAASTGLVVWWLLGQMLLWRIVRAARPVPPDVQAEFLQISGPAGRSVVLLENATVTLPFTYTWWRPVVLLPGALCDGSGGDELRFCLAHEWSHIERRDARAWNLAALAGFVMFYQPLFWWLRRQLRLCQDYLADDRAAALTSAEDYAMYLVRLARARHTVSGLPALGVSDRRSNLFRRVTMLVQDHHPLEHRCRAFWSLAAAASAAAVIVVASGLRLDGAQSGQDAKPKDALSAPAAAKESVVPKDNPATAETLHYSGKVKEIGTGKPIAGATVVVRRSILKRNNENTILQETHHTTDANGVYSFTIPPEQVAERYLYIELDVAHPDYATQAGFGYALSMIRKNEKMGGRPFFENIELRPGKPIAGHVERPDGSPAKGVSILAYSRSGKLKVGETFEYGSFSKAKVDEAGNFQVNVTTPGLAVFWILPDDLAGELHGVPEGKRGDLGRFTLKPGASLKGRVLDVDGKPIAGIFVNAERERNEEVNEIIGQLAVADAVNRTAVTAADGSFTMAPLPSGHYRVLPGDRARDGSEQRKVRPLAAVFTPRKVELKDGETPETLEMRASPHAVIEAQWLDGNGKPTSGFAGHIFGRIDDGYWFGEAKVDPDGKSVAHVPHGLENVQLNLMTNEHHAIRWRKAKGEPLRRNHTINLGTLDHDVKGIEIVHYTAPILTVKGETTDHKPVPGLKVSANYIQEEKGRADGKRILAGGVQSDVGFEKQEDGRFRSEQLQPDLEFTVTAQADGFKPADRKLTLGEGKTEDITLVLEPK